MVAVPLLRGALTARDYEDAAAADPRIDALRAVTEVVEHPGFTRDYLDPEKRSIGNAVQVFFRDGTATERIAVEYPVGHRRRRAEGLPLLQAKFEAAVRGRFPAARADALIALLADAPRLEATPVTALMELLWLG
jgi:2-methylcitrate dehydratase PrpD